MFFFIFIHQQQFDLDKLHFWRLMKWLKFFFLMQIVPNDLKAINFCLQNLFSVSQLMPIYCLLHLRNGYSHRKKIRTIFVRRKNSFFRIFSVLFWFSLGILLHFDQIRSRSQWRVVVEWLSVPKTKSPIICATIKYLIRIKRRIENFLNKQMRLNKQKMRENLN